MENRNYDNRTILESFMVHYFDHFLNGSGSVVAYSGERMFQAKLNRNQVAVEWKNTASD